jgi:hypothetical protein
MLIEVSYPRLFQGIEIEGEPVIKRREIEIARRYSRVAG